MNLRIPLTSPRRTARITGAFYLLTIVTGILAQFVVSARLIAHDPATTAANILANRSLYELGFTIYMVEMIAQIVTTALFLVLLEPVSRGASLVAAFLGLAGCTIKTVARVFYLVPMYLLADERYAAAFSHDQVHALGTLLLKVSDRGAATALAMFGAYALVSGMLIFRSRFLPRFLGVLSALGGLGWLTYLSPSLGDQLFPILALIGLVGALALIGWLLVVGVDEPRWRDRAGAAE